MSVTAILRTDVSFVDTNEGEYVAEGDNTLAFDGMNKNATLTALTVPPATNGTMYQIPLVAGAATITLTTLTAVVGDNPLVGTGKKVQGVKFRNLAANLSPISVTAGAANGHSLLGNLFLFSLLPGQSVTFMNEGVDVGPDIAAGDATWDVAGTGVEILEMALVLG